ncbi:hypothetical protein pipiens_011282 [Culex pipiens pipiens]|uniref:Uncharacterized protein n=1 Tax=Culex pipiens pipiens TaxID=38569 RepID=A0ABD1D6Z8_CULPP
MNLRWLFLVACFGCIFHASHGSIINRAIEAQKALIEREEAFVEDTRNAIRDRTDRAMESARQLLLSTAERMIQIATYPIRYGGQLAGQSRQLLSSARERLLSFNPVAFFTDPGTSTEAVIIHQEEDDVPYLEKMEMRMATMPKGKPEDVVFDAPALEMLSNDVHGDEKVAVSDD